jgi:hypothetical protein
MNISAICRARPTASVEEAPSRSLNLPPVVVLLIPPLLPAQWPFTRWSSSSPAGVVQASLERQDESADSQSFGPGAVSPFDVRALAKPRSVAMKRAIIGPTSRAGSTGGWPDWRPRASP